MHDLRVYGAALLVPGLPIGILVRNVAGFWAADGSAGLPARLTWGGIGAALAAASVGTSSLFSERRAGLGGGIGPHRSSTITVRGRPRDRGTPDLTKGRNENGGALTHGSPPRTAAHPGRLRTTRQLTPVPTPSAKARQEWSPCRPRVSTGVAPGRVHCGTGRLVGPQVVFPSASERQYQHESRPSGQPSGLSSHASPRP